MAADWMTRAACRDETPDLFFPVGNTGPALLQIEAAKAVCRRCPVLGDCRHWALTTREPDGVWGGLSEDDRDDILTGRRRRLRKPAETVESFEVCHFGEPCPDGDSRHGTSYGYRLGCRGVGCLTAQSTGRRCRAVA